MTFMRSSRNSEHFGFNLLHVFNYKNFLILQLEKFMKFLGTLITRTRASTLDLKHLNIFETFRLILESLTI